MPRSSSLHSARTPTVFQTTSPATRKQCRAPGTLDLMIVVMSPMLRQLCFCRSPRPSHLSPSRWTSPVRCLTHHLSPQSTLAMFITSKVCTHLARLTMPLTQYQTARPLSSTARRSHLSLHQALTSLRRNPNCLPIMHCRPTIFSTRWSTCILSM